MRYIWIWMLLGIDAIWWILSIVDVVRTVKFVKNNRQYSSVGDFIDCMIEKLEGSTIQCILLHIFVLFIASFIAWLAFNTRGLE